MLTERHVEVTRHLIKSMLLIIQEIYFVHNYFLIASMIASQFSYRRNDDSTFLNIINSTTRLK
jgi:hypothetical protein